MKLEYGTVSAWDNKTCRIRVELHENGLSSYWLQVPQGYSKTTKRRCPVELGTQVAILLTPDGVGGVLLGAVFSEAEPPPITDDDTDYIEYSDGAVMSYAPSTHTLTVNLPVGGNINLTSPTGVNINSPTTTIDGDLVVKKKLTYMGGMEGFGGNGGSVATINGGIQIKGAANVEGNITTDGSITAKGSITEHG